MRFNKKITLITLVSPTGRNEPRETAKANVWADVSDVGAVTKLTALTTGQELSLSVIMWRREYKGYTHAEYLGKRYKIVQTGSANNELYIKLLLERG